MLRLWDTQIETPLRTLPLAELVGHEKGSIAAIQGKNELELPAVRSVELNPDQTQALVTLFDPETSTYRVGSWNWSNKRAPVQWLSAGLHDTSTALYSPGRDGSILTVGGRERTYVWQIKS